MTGPGPGGSAGTPYDVYLAEYKIVADRYENIYKAIWQHFSYMAALAAGIVALGSKSANPAAVALAAGTPLLFWFYASYLPMDHYARSARRRAEEIEDAINALVFTPTLSQRNRKEPTKEFDRFARWAPRALLGGAVWFVASLSESGASKLSILRAAIVGTAIVITLSYAVTRPKKAPVPALPMEPATDGEALRGDSQNSNGMRHFQGFGGDDPVIHWSKARIAPYFHVNQVVIACFFVLTFLWVAMVAPAYKGVTNPPHPSTDTLSVRLVPGSATLVDAKIELLRSEVDDLVRRLRVSDSSLQALRRP